MPVLKLWEVEWQGSGTIVASPDAVSAAASYLGIWEGMEQAGRVAHGPSVGVTAVEVWHRPGGGVKFAAACPIGWVRTDPLFGLAGFDAQQLRRMARAAWRDVERRQWWTGAGPLAWWSMRHRVALGLRLALELPWVASPWGPGYPAPESSAAGELERLRALHGANVPDHLILTMYREAGPAMIPFSDTALHAMAELAMAYGLTPETMKWSELAALWTSGPQGLEQARLDNSLGLHDYFAYGPERPTRDLWREGQ